MTECGDLLALGETSQPVKFEHDPKQGTRSAGESLKVLTVSEPRPGKVNKDTAWIYVGLRRSGIDSKNYTIPITPGEFEVLRTVARDYMSRMLGFDEAWDAVEDSAEAEVKSQSRA